jgi:endonuclease/exonuclease/phosphatase (EEP) superfamily protein YafD
VSSPTAGSSSSTTTPAGRYAVAGVVALWLCLLAGLLGRFGWLFDLFANFQVQYFVLFVTLAFLLILLDRRKAAFVSLAGAGVAAMPLVAYMSLPGRTAEATPAKFRLVSLNIWYRNRDITGAARFLEGAHADVVVVQELTGATMQELQRLLPSYPHVASVPSQFGGVIYSRWPLVGSEPVALSEGVSGTLATLDWQGRNVSVLGVHLHWPVDPWSARKRDQELRSVATFAAGFDGPLLVAGDLNLTPWSQYFRRLLRESRLNDAAASQGWMPSWPSQFRLVGIRIDQCLTTAHWRSLSVATGPHVGSDHRPLVIDLELQAEPGLIR